MKIREGVICEVLFFFSNLVFCNNMSNNGTPEGVTGGIDTKFIMEALTKVKIMFRDELEQFHERVEQIEALTKVKIMFRDELEQFHERVEQSLEQPRNPPIGCRREKFPRRGVRLEEEGYEGDSFKDEIDRDSIVSGRRYEGRLREARNWEDNNLGSIKMKIPSFQGKNDLETCLEWERKVELIIYCHNYSKIRR